MTKRFPEVLISKVGDGHTRDDFECHLEEPERFLMVKGQFQYFALVPLHTIVPELPPTGRRDALDQSAKGGSRV